MTIFEITFETSSEVLMDELEFRFIQESETSLAPLPKLYKKEMRKAIHRKNKHNEEIAKRLNKRKRKEAWSREEKQF